MSEKLGGFRHSTWTIDFCYVIVQNEKKALWVHSNEEVMMNHPQCVITKMNFFDTTVLSLRLYFLVHISRIRTRV